jgi:hypothetical protein
MNVTATSTWEIVPATELPPGKLITIRDEPGTVVLRFCKGHIRAGLRDQLAAWHGIIFGEGVLIQRYADHAAAEGTPLAVARVEFVRPGVLPAGRLCWPIFAESEFIWLIAEGQMSEELRRQFSELVARNVADGHWIQSGDSQSLVSAM